MTERVILVNESDEETGTMEKQEAHLTGTLHRAFSIFIFNDKNELLLQQRASNKYHSPLLWTNTCCSHPRANEETIDAAARRLNEEMGISNCNLKEAFSFIYKANVGQGLTEHEFDHVFFGRFNGIPEINKEEVENWEYMALSALELDIKNHPEKYTEWFKLIFNRVRLHLNNS